jgi:hypothetical protein
MEQFKKTNSYYGNKITSGVSSVRKRFLRFVKNEKYDEDEDEEGGDPPSDFDF